MKSEIRRVLENLIEDIETSKQNSQTIGGNSTHSYLSNEKEKALDTAEEAVNSLFSKESKACQKT